MTIAAKKPMSHQRKAAFRKKIEILFNGLDMEYGPFEFTIERFDPGTDPDPSQRTGRVRHILTINTFKKP